MDNTIKVYVRPDSTETAIKIFSSIFETPLDTDVLIDTSTETSDRDKFAHADSQYLEKGLLDSNQCYNYKIVDNKLVERTDSEKQTDPKYVEKVRQNKLNEISAVCEQTIYVGTDVHRAFFGNSSRSDKSFCVGSHCCSGCYASALSCRWAALPRIHRQRVYNRVYGS